MLNRLYIYLFKLKHIQYVFLQFGKSRKEILHQQLSKILNTSLENVDVFTVMPSASNHSFLDVRFSAHGSPYYAPERIENKITEHQDKVSIKSIVSYSMFGEKKNI